MMNKSQVIEKIGNKNWDMFCKFMEGQTVRIKDGEFDYYSVDVDNFIAKIGGKPYYFDQVIR